jgi:broad specificity phosphatase PhoE
VLILVRHGRTEANASGLLLGRLDPVLDELGEAQARALGAVVGDVERVITSPLTRTRQTAAELGDDVEVDDRWIELDYGELDGTPTRDVPADVWARWRADVDFAPPGGESFRQLGVRVAAACAELAEEAIDHDIAVVTHVSPIKAAVAWALGAGEDLAWRLYVAPASISRVAVSPGGAVLHSFNEVAHLAGTVR